MITKHAYWIHHAYQTDETISGYIYLPKCDCSNCGYTSSMEKSICPSCQSIMDRTAPKDAMVEKEKKEESR